MNAVRNNMEKRLTIQRHVPVILLKSFPSESRLSQRAFVERSLATVVFNVHRDGFRDDFDSVNDEWDVRFLDNYHHEQFIDFRNVMYLKGFIFRCWPASTWYWPCQNSHRTSSLLLSQCIPNAQRTPPGTQIPSETVIWSTPSTLSLPEPSERWWWLHRCDAPNHGPRTAWFPRNQRRRTWRSEDE